MQQGGDGLEHRGAAAPGRLGERPRIAGRGVVHEQHPAAGEQGREHLPDRDVESLRSVLDDPVVRRQAQRGDLGEQVVELAPVMDHGPLGQAGRAGGEDHVGEALRRRLRQRRGRARRRVQSREVHDLWAVPGCEAGGHLGEDLPVRLSGEDQGGAGLLQHQPEARRRLARIERQEGAPGGLHRQHGGEKVDAAVGEPGHHGLGAGAAPRQLARPAVHAARQLAIGETALAFDRGHGVRRGRGLLGEPAGRGGRREGDGGGVPLHEEGLALPGAQQSEAGDLGFRFGQGVFEEHGEAVEEPLGGGAVEEVHVVVEHAADAIAELGHGEGEVELGRVGVDAERRQAQAGQRALLLRGVLKHEEDLEERRVAEAALGLQLLDELLERQVLMGVGFQGDLAHAPEELAEAGLAGEARAQDEGVDEKPDEAFGLQAGAARERRADADVQASGEAGEQSLEGPQQGHEQGSPLAAAEAAQGAGEARGEKQSAALAAVALHLRPCAVGGKLQEGRRAGEAAAPGGELALQRFAAQPAALPDGVVGVLHRQLGQGGGPAAAERVVEDAELAHQHAHGPPVAGDVVRGEQSGMLPFAEARELAAQQRSALEIERPFRLVAGDAQRRVLRGRPGKGRKIDDGKPERRGGIDLLHRLAVHRGAGGGERVASAQDLVAADDLAEGELQSGDVERAGEPRAQRNVVERVAGRQPVEEPETLLGEGEGEVPFARQRRQGWDGAGVPGAERLLDPRGEAGDRGGVEQGAQQQLGAKGLAHAGDELGGEQRVAAQLEEIGLDADPVVAQHLLPEAGQQLLDLVARRLLPGPPLAARRRAGSRQGVAVDLAVGG